MTKHKQLFIYISIILISLIMCFGFITGHYAIDDYKIMYIGYNNYSIKKSLIEGRPIMFLIDQLFLKLNYSYDSFFIITVVLAILLTDLNILLVYNLIKDKFAKNNKYILIMILFTTIFNFMYIENLYYPESIVMALSLVFYTISANYFFKDGKKSKLLALLFSILATLSYNGLECYYITIISLLSLFNNKSINKKIFIDILVAGLIIILSILVDYLQILICGHFFNLIGNRIIFKPIFNLGIIILHMPKLLINTINLYPKYLFVLLLFFLLIVSYCIDYKRKQNNLLKENAILIFISITSCFCLSVVSLSSFGKGRLLYGVGMTIGLVLLNIIRKYKKDNIPKIIICFCLIWSIFNVFNYFSKTMQCKKINEYEKQEMLKLDEDLQEYEKYNNVKVDKIVFVFLNDNKFNSSIYDNGLTNLYSSKEIIHFYTGREMKEVKDDKKYEERLKDNNYLIEYDTLYVKITDW